MEPGAGREQASIALSSHTSCGPGKHWRRRSDEDEQHLRVQSITLHPLYDPSTFENDLGLVELSESPRLNDFVMPICLPEHPSTEGTCLTQGYYCCHETP